MNTQVEDVDLDALAIRALEVENWRLSRSVAMYKEEQAKDNARILELQEALAKAKREGMKRAADICRTYQMYAHPSMYYDRGRADCADAIEAELEKL